MSLNGDESDESLQVPLQNFKSGPRENKHMDPLQLRGILDKAISAAKRTPRTTFWKDKTAAHVTTKPSL